MKKTNINDVKVIEKKLQENGYYKIVFTVGGKTFDCNFKWFGSSESVSFNSDEFKSHDALVAELESACTSGAKIDGWHIFLNEVLYNA